MRASGGRRLCQEARVYYYDLLSPNEAVVPESVRRHVARCPVCREQMGRLRDTLFEAERQPSPRDSHKDETIEALTHQFQLLDQQVTCSEAKPCLPELAGASPPVRIPTPVTVHVDHCPACAQDLAALRELHLAGDQLKQLVRLLRRSADRAAIVCWQARSAVVALGSLSFEGTDARSLDHVAACPQCRAQVYRRRERHWGAVHEERQPREEIACRDISTTDLFDFVVPRGVEPAGRNAADQRRRAIAAHVRVCPACLGKVQRLHRTIYGVVEREDSDTTTVYHALDAAAARGPAGDDYRYPVSVQVSLGAAGSVSAPNGVPGARATGRRRHRVSGGSLARIGACLVVLFGLALLLRTTAPTASGTNLGDMLRTLEQAPNIHVVTKYRSGTTTQEYWIARRANRLVHRLTEGLVLIDLNDDHKRTIDARTGALVSARLSKIERDWARQIMAGCLENVLERISPDARLHHPAGAVAPGDGEGVEVYELILPRQTENPRLRTRWWVYIDPATGLPQRTEVHRKGSLQGPWNLVTATSFTYLTDEEMDNSLRALFPGL
jgi:hypothetical protein